jgi:hypothetical protein
MGEADFPQRMGTEGLIAGQGALPAAVPLPNVMRMLWPLPARMRIGRFRGGLFGALCPFSDLR